MPALPVSDELTDGVVLLRRLSIDDVQRICEIVSDPAIRHRNNVPQAKPAAVRDWLGGDLAR